MKKLLLIFPATVLLVQSVMAQCPIVTCPSTLNIPCSITGTGVNFTATSNYASNITSSWKGPGNIKLVSGGTSTSVININHVGTYTVTFVDNSSSCVVTETVLVSNSSNNMPTFNPVISSYTLTCPGGTGMLNMANANTTPIGGVVTFAVGSTSTAPVFSNWMNPFPPPVNSCGSTYLMVRDNGNLCTSSYVIDIICQMLPAPAISIVTASGGSVCAGSSVNMTAVGANSYTWSTGTTGAQLISPPINNTVPTGSVNTFTVAGTNSFGCIGSATIAIIANTTCAMVWPGDANSDGVVDNTDLFELGFSYGTTGTARAGASNVYIAQYSDIWSGSGSTGKNKNHIDCNGDGTINNADTLAIYNNYSLTHAFKPSAASSTGDVSLEIAQNFATIGGWNVADILLGSVASPLSSLYGAAFDINFDPLQISEAYVVYTSSFLSSSSQDIKFRKVNMTTGQLHAALVKSNGQNASGNGKIGEFYYKLKGDLPLNTAVNLSVSGAKKVSNSGTVDALTGNNTNVISSNSVVGIKKYLSTENLGIAPNPASGQLKLSSAVSEQVTYTLYDVIGKEISTGMFTGSKTLDLAGIESGAYIFKFECNGNMVYKKIVVEK